jgi:hypothetical protein
MQSVLNLPPSQRDCVLQPRVARNELPWENTPEIHNPNGVAARRRADDTTPLGLKTFCFVTQGSSCLATLGYAAESLWDSTAANVEFQTAP